MPPSYCMKEKKPCIGWVDNYFGDCLCNLRDEFSFGFGLISLVCWGVAEIPQIITNFRTKSSHGVSLAFLLTWIAGFVLFSSPFNPLNLKSSQKLSCSIILYRSSKKIMFFSFNFLMQ